MLSLSLSLSHSAGLQVKPAQVFRCKSARAVCRPGPLALSIAYSGLVRQSEFDVLDRLTLPARLAHRVSIERMDHAITPPEVPIVIAHHWPAGLPVSVVIVRDDQYDYSQAFCYALGLVGVNRLTFRVSETALALAFVDRLTA